MLKVELRNLQRKVALNKGSLKELTEKVASELKIDEGELSVVFVGLNRMKKINYTYLNRKAPTDVLSFHLDENPFSGEIIICPEAIIARNSQMFEGGEKEERKIEEEIFRRIVHGLLHLCHFDHQTVAEARAMEAKENKLLETFLVKR